MRLNSRASRNNARLLEGAEKGGTSAHMQQKCSGFSQCASGGGTEGAAILPHVGGSPDPFC